MCQILVLFDTCHKNQVPSRCGKNRRVCCPCGEKIEYVDRSFMSEVRTPSVSSQESLLRYYTRLHMLLCMSAACHALLNVRRACSVEQ